MKFDDLEHFKNWWMKYRPFNPPMTDQIIQHGTVQGVVLFRQYPYQVQLFITRNKSVITPHIHPNVDSFEVFLTGDMTFMADGILYSQATTGDSTRVLPSCWHGGFTGENGASFLSIQKWLNGEIPSSVGNDWADKNGNTFAQVFDASNFQGDLKTTQQVAA
jgi:hypothetical protein